MIKMVGPDFLAFKRSLRHSAKGSEWEEHKYIKKIDGDYYYPDSYEGGRHLPDGDGGSSGESSKESDNESKSSEDTGTSRAGSDKFREALEKVSGRSVANLTNSEIEALREKYKDKLSTESKAGDQKILTPTKKAAVKAKSKKKSSSDKKNEKKTETKTTEKLSSWEKKMYKNLDAAAKNDPDITDVKGMSTDDFRSFLSDYAEMDVEEMSDSKIKSMQKKVQSHYSSKESTKKSTESDRPVNMNRETANKLTSVLNKLNSVKIESIKDSKTLKKEADAAKKALAKSTAAAKKVASSSSKSSGKATKSKSDDTPSTSTSTSSTPKSTAKKYVKPSTTKSVDIDKVLEVYKKKRR